MRIAVIDGQGGGIGTSIIRKIKDVFAEAIEVWALGTNAIATAQMMKAGANKGATGENAIRHSIGQVDVVAGPISVLVTHSMMGEVTPAIANAVGSCSAVKLLLPLTQDPVTVIGTVREPLPHLVDKLIQHLTDLLTAQETP